MTAVSLIHSNLYFRVTNNQMKIEKAVPDDHEVLTAVTKKSKAYWGYSETQIELWSEFLTVTKNYIETQSVFKAAVDDKIAGYYSFYPEDDYIKLDNLFVLPEYIGKGIGKMLLLDFLHRTKAAGANKIKLHSEPNSELFYAKYGFVKTGQIETSIKDRYLPVMELDIK